MFPAILVQVLIALLIIGVVLWALSQFPIDPMIAKLIRVIIIVVVAIWLIYLLASILPSFGGPYGGSLYRR
jgi:hypothetical protein